MFNRNTIVLCMAILFQAYGALGNAQDYIQPEYTESEAPEISTGENTSKISLKLKNMDIIEVFNILSQKGKLNIVAGNNVRGRVTLFLENVNVWEAFKHVAETNNLAYIREDDVIRVITDREYELLYGQRFFDKTSVRIFRLKYTQIEFLKPVIEGLKSRIGNILLDTTSNSIIVSDTDETMDVIAHTIESLDVPLTTKVYLMKYANPKEIEAKISPLISKRGNIQYDTNANKIIVTDIPASFELIDTLINEYDAISGLSTVIFTLKYADYEKIQEQIKTQITEDVGIIEVDERTDKIVVTDYPDVVEKIAKIILAFDDKHREVIIEAKLIQINLENAFKYGVNWEYVATAIANQNISLQLSSAFSVLSEIPQADTSPYYPYQQKISTKVPPFDQRAAVNPGGRVMFAGLADGGIDGQGNPYQGIIDALRTQGNVNILSTPKIAVINHEEAKIQVGTNEAYVTTSVVQNSSNATTAESVNFIQVGVLLKVTPHINEDGYVTMDIEPEVSSVASFLQTASGNQIPIVRTSNAKTTVMVKDGVTIVIGGLIDRIIRKRKKRVPILGSIPILGLPFKSVDNEEINRELVIFLTPHIISGDVQTDELIRFDKRFPDTNKLPGLKEDVQELLQK
ncbi:MAG: secretin N-terminal domain-containing protein [Chlamydiota bacterium]|nr:secretin N-terminal domain-containing protein [Chlamydiota bacterium]